MDTSQITSGRAPADGPSGSLLTIAAYVMLLLLGAAQGMLGAFFYSVGPVPAAPLGFDLALFVTCLFAVWGMAKPTAAFVPAAGWFIVVFVLASARKDGSVLVTASAAGELFLFGGGLVAMVAIFGAFMFASRRGAGPGGSRYPSQRPKAAGPGSGGGRPS